MNNCDKKKKNWKYFKNFIYKNKKYSVQLNNIKITQDEFKEIINKNYKFDTEEIVFAYDKKFENIIPNNEKIDKIYKNHGIIYMELKKDIQDILNKSVEEINIDYDEINNDLRKITENNKKIQSQLEQQNYLRKKLYRQDYNPIQYDVEKDKIINSYVPNIEELDEIFFSKTNRAMIKTISAEIKFKDFEKKIKELKTENSFDLEEFKKQNKIDEEINNLEELFNIMYKRGNNRNDFNIHLQRHYNHSLNNLRKLRKKFQKLYEEKIQQSRDLSLSYLENCLNDFIINQDINEEEAQEFKSDNKFIKIENIKEENNIKKEESNKKLDYLNIINIYKTNIKDETNKKYVEQLDNEIKKELEENKIEYSNLNISSNEIFKKCIENIKIKNQYNFNIEKINEFEKNILLFEKEYSFKSIYNFLESCIDNKKKLSYEEKLKIKNILNIRFPKIDESKIKNKLNFIMDLDSTLIFSKVFSKAISSKNINNENNNINNNYCNYIEFQFNEEKICMFLTFRPELNSFFNNIKPYMNFYIYTLSFETYAKTIIDLLQEKYNISIEKFYYRENNSKISKNFDSFDCNPNKSIIFDDTIKVWEHIINNREIIDKKYLVIPSKIYIDDKLSTNEDFNKLNNLEFNLNNKENWYDINYVSYDNKTKIIDLERYTEEDDCCFIEYPKTVNKQLDYLKKILKKIFYITYYFSYLSTYDVKTLISITLFTGKVFYFDKFEDEFLSNIIISMGGEIIKQNELDNNIYKITHVISEGFSKNRIKLENIEFYKEIVKKNEKIKIINVKYIIDCYYFLTDLNENDDIYKIKLNEKKFK